MSTTAFAIVLAAAFLHALWNALVKASGDRAVMIGLILMGHVLFGVALSFFVPLPSWESTPYIAASTIIHWGYYFLIYHAYRLGDLSLVYPISRGMAPMLVALGAMWAVSETLPILGWMGVVAVSLGVLLLSWQSLKGNISLPSIWLAIATGFDIAAYSVVDGMGARVSGTTVGYMAWLFICEGFVLFFLLATRAKWFLRMGPRIWMVGIIGGLASALAYGLAIHAKTIAPIGLVSALRETSVVIAAGIGVIWLNERPWKLRVVAAGIVATGIVLIALA